MQILVGPRSLRADRCEQLEVIELGPGLLIVFVRIPIDPEGVVPPPAVKVALERFEFVVSRQPILPSVSLYRRWSEFRLALLSFCVLFGHRARWSLNFWRDGGRWWWKRWSILSVPRGYLCPVTSRWHRYVLAPATLCQTHVGETELSGDLAYRIRPDEFVKLFSGGSFGHRAIPAVWCQIRTSGMMSDTPGIATGLRFSNPLNCQPFLHDFGSVPGSHININ